VIHADLQHAAHVLCRTAEMNPVGISKLVPLLAVGLILAQRELLLHLWQTEAEP